MAKLENVYEWVGLLRYSVSNEIANWNAAHRALVDINFSPEWNRHLEVYRHLVDKEQREYLLKDEKIEYEIGESWFETGPSKNDIVAYKIIDGFMRENNLWNATFI